MKKVAGLLSIIFLALLVISFSATLMRKVATLRSSKTSLLGFDNYEYGDLFGMSYLKRYKVKLDYNSNDVKLITYNTPSYNLFVAGDSYLSESFVKNDSIFCGVRDYWYSKYTEPPKILQLKPNQKNILLIETVERNLRFFNDPSILNNINLSSAATPDKTVKKRFPFDRVLSLLTREYADNPILNENLEFNLFGYKLFTPLKEFKATLNYRLFNSVNNDVMISPDNKYLFYKSTIDTSSSSSFAIIKDKEVSRIVNVLNKAYKRYKAAGFDEVYFSIIPNPVTTLAPNILGTIKYNELIPRIQNNPDLQVPVIDVFELFRRSKIQIYFTSDTHWNNNGFHLWANEFNKRINEDIK